ncbi:uncharacterized protein LOC125025694 [Penaeus chinensis]|uniref:uncharacterized protein LOC125025694 n=1 Tax=Penaeus chinensis TaxID=139456 RepID=UPI001FB6FFEC|nr:uncharacterized protein LOC125025694 [Penaeus chinensis]
MTAEAWRSLEEAAWGPMPSLGPEWMGKSSASDSGYLLMLTDGCGVWGERRTAAHVLEKAEEWAPCIEAGIKELSGLVLDEVRKLNVKVQWREDRKTITLNLSSRLNDLAFKWIFTLNRLSDDLFREHWIVPLVIQMHHMGIIIKQLNTDLKKKTEQLKDLTPDTKNNKMISKTKKKDVIDASVEALMVEGNWTVLQDHLVNFPHIMKHLSSKRKRELEESEDPPGAASIAAAANKGQVNNKKCKEEEEELQRQEREREKERRAQIQELQQGPPLTQTPNKKKKKKLNI